MNIAEQDAALPSVYVHFAKAARETSAIPTLFESRQFLLCFRYHNGRSQTSVCTTDRRPGVRFLGKAGSLGSLNLRDLVIALEDFRSLGIDFISLHERVDTSIPNARHNTKDMEKRRK